MSSLMSFINTKSKLTAKRKLGRLFMLTLYGPNSFFRRFLGHNLR